MLVLSRKPEESIVIGDDIEVVVIEIKGEHVKLGVRAPRSVSVHRKEVYEAIQKANVEASTSEAEHLAHLAKALRESKQNES